ncbi:MAG: hypothetical protein OXU77_02405 [Gammaproteobacteria bacterium]|nr:hypothetical protein [Gammaproteobacteria bacterium]
MWNIKPMSGLADVEREVRSFTIKFSISMVVAIALGVLIAWML